ncbi:DMT family transporter [Flectobacillus roseus]|uniref:DMT family transporter n=1 Tax=Flectobacillus roseus TaxID=502259 RepID=UPI0024B66D2E|nr:EamA family transporter [Flectobacillus roseus]MDI9869238.1 EamA family transporter [Flectobacillus roseus]
MKNILAGLFFAMLWASASAATKIGLLDAQPFVIGNCRFFIAGFIMLSASLILQKSRLPQGKEWKQLAIYGFLNVTLYLGCFVLAMKKVSAGIGSLSTATNPLIISVISAIWMKRAIKKGELTGLILGILGVAIATYPLLVKSYASVDGLLILATSMISYSMGTIYYSKQKWDLPLLTINGWQVLIGGVMLLPVTFFMTDWENNHYTVRFWSSVFWLVVPVSIAAVQLWLYLLKTDAVKASLWLFLCPIFGFVYASVLLDEPITTYTYIGTALVILGLYVAQREKFQSKSST